jgi:hypothetical protein
MKAVWIMLTAVVLSCAPPLTAQSNGQKLSQTTPKKAAVPPPPSSAAPTSPAADTTPCPGRYQIVFNPNVRADTFLLDTQTGRVWRPVAFTDLEGDPDVWKFMPRVDDIVELSRWVGTQTYKPARKTP